MSERYYLKPSVVFEPLINQWHASEILISPAHHRPSLQALKDKCLRDC